MECVFNKIPDIVWYNHLLQYLKWNDLLRFRRVCKLTKKVTDDFIQNGKTPSKGIPRMLDIEINETDKSLESFIKLGFPVTCIYLDNSQSGMEFFENPSIPKFLEKFGKGIRYVNVKQISFENPKEKEFYEGLPNLRVLVADGVIPIPNYSPEMAKKHFSPKFFPEEEGKEWDPPHPKNLPALNALVICREPVDSKIFDHRQVIPFFVNTCNSELIAPPFCVDEYEFPNTEEDEDDDNPEENQGSFQNLSRDIFSVTTTELLGRKHLFGDNGNLREYDFRNYAEMNPVMAARLSCSYHFFGMIKSLVDAKVQLLNVPATLLQNIDLIEVVMDMWEDRVGSRIFSLDGLHPMVLKMRMPNLERIVVKKTSTSSVGLPAPDWPKLKCVEVNVDSAILAAVNCFLYKMPPIETKWLLDVLFVGVTRLLVTHVRLSWVEGICEEFKKKVLVLPIPRADDLISSCPNLTKLELINWPGTNKALVKLWGALGQLVEIRLESCKELGNSAFVGKNVEKPVFLELKKLKRLSLVGLDTMPKVTDTLFKLVLRNMKLTHLILFSDDKMLSNITEVGIRALLTGEFADSIEKFPFLGWKLAGMESDEFTSLKNEFRSSFMI